MERETVERAKLNTDKTLNAEAPPKSAESSAKDSRRGQEGGVDEARGGSDRSRQKGGKGEGCGVDGGGVESEVVKKRVGDKFLGMFVWQSILNVARVIIREGREELNVASHHPKGERGRSIRAYFLLTKCCATLTRRCFENGQNTGIASELAASAGLFLYTWGGTAGGWAVRWCKQLQGVSPPGFAS